MSKEYIPNPNTDMNAQQYQPPMQPVNPQPPKGPGKLLIILGAVAVVVLIALIVLVIIAAVPKKDGTENENQKAATSASASTQVQGKTTSSAGSQGGQVTPEPDDNQGGMPQAEFIALLNEETAKAAKGSYNISRTGDFIKSVDVGEVTELLNEVIRSFIDSNASLDSVVGSFFDISEDTMTGKVTNGKSSDIDSKHLIKAMNITEDDVVGYIVQGNQYSIQIKNSKNPDSSSSLARATNDYIVFSDVNKEIDSLVGDAVELDEKNSTVDYTMIAIVATVEDGKITEIKYSYTLKVNFRLRVTFVEANGNLEADLNCAYTDIKY